jgi:hypothetical protein
VIAVIRGPDGSMTAGNPHAAARRLQAEHPGWSVWWGPACARFFAMSPDGRRLVEAATVAEMAAKLRPGWRR